MKSLFFAFIMTFAFSGPVWAVKCVYEVRKKLDPLLAFIQQYEPDQQKLKQLKHDLKTKKITKAEFNQKALPIETKIKEELEPATKELAHMRKKHPECFGSK